MPLNFTNRTCIRKDIYGKILYFYIIKRILKNKSHFYAILNYHAFIFSYFLLFKTLNI